MFDLRFPQAPVGPVALPLPCTPERERTIPMKNLTLKVLLITVAVTSLTYVVGEVGANGEGSNARSTSVDADATGVAPVVEGPLANSTLDDIDRLIRDTEAQIGSTPTSSSLDLLARLLLSRGRMTGEATSYADAESAARRSLEIAPRNPEAQAIQTEVLYANHQFSEAAAKAKAIFDADPTQLGALAVYSDSLRELGDVVGASSVVDRLETLAPGLPSVTVRRARIYTLTGQSDLADRAAQRAEAAARQSGLLGPTLAFYSSFRGQLAFDSGDYATALEHFDESLAVADGDRVATVGRARTLAAMGRLSEARQILSALTERYPEPGSLALLEDVHRAEDDEVSASMTSELVDAVAGIARSNQQIYNRELALYYANHDRNLAEALKLARAEITQRKDLHAYDTLAWAEFKSGNPKEAAAAAEQALASGARDAAVWYHAGMIALANGERIRGVELLEKALALNPSFDVRQAPLARAALSKVGNQ